MIFTETIIFLEVASRALRISESYFHVSETSTVTVPNTSPTAASASSDLNGMAVLVSGIMVICGVNFNPCPAMPGNIRG